MQLLKCFFYKCRIAGMNAITKAINAVGGVSKFAKGLGVTTQAACFWRDGKRKFPAEHCPAAEKMTMGAVTCEELFPSVDWAYLRGTAPIDCPPESEPTPAIPAPTPDAEIAEAADDQAMRAGFAAGEGA